MTDGDSKTVEWVVAGILLVAGIIYAYLKRPRCPKCDVPLKLVRSEDNFSLNITNKIRIGPIIDGIPHDEYDTYRCPRCGKETRKTEKFYG